MARLDHDRVILLLILNLPLGLMSRITDG